MLLPGTLLASSRHSRESSELQAAHSCAEAWGGWRSPQSPEAPPVTTSGVQFHYKIKFRIYGYRH